MRKHVAICRVDLREPVLVVGGSQEDAEVLSSCGFKRIVVSNLIGAEVVLDAEEMALPDNSYEVVFAHAVLHHCRSPQKAVGEMVRVSRRHVFFVEPNDSLALRQLVRRGFSFPYELAAVVDNGYVAGGMRNGPIPNYIYRWTGREVEKSVSAYHPESQFNVYAHPYWDFYVNEHELLIREETRVAALAARVGASRLLAFLHFSQAVLNAFPVVRWQGNKFFCAISKRELQPWVEIRDGQCLLRRHEG